jgi:hypothetical protein
MLTKKAKTRLLKLVEYMEGLPRSANKHFGMSHWFAHLGDDAEKHGLVRGVTVAPEHYHACGTTACVLGWAAKDRRFQRIGLRLRPFASMDDDGIAPLEAAGFTGMEVWGGISSVFDIEQWQAEELFSAENNDRTPKAWGRRARKLLKGWSAAA